MRPLVIVTALALVLAGADFATSGSVRASARPHAASLSSLVASAGEALPGKLFFASRNAILAENQALSSEVARLSEAEYALRALQKEHDALRAVLSLPEHGEAVAAPIVSSFRASPYGTFLIGAGEKAGVQPGALVLTEHGFIVGRVEDVSQHSSLARLLFAPGERVDVVVGSASLSLEGRGGSARVEVPQGVEVVKGDVVIAPHWEGRPVGVIAHVESDVAQAYNTAHVALPVNINAIRFVLLVPVPTPESEES